MIQQLAGLVGRLNAFQSLMCLWSQQFPYNATHVFKLAGRARPDALGQAIRETYAVNRIGLVQLDAKHGVYRHETDYAPALMLVPGGPSSEQCLNRHLTAELNRPFERPRGRPFRFGVLDAGPAAHYVSLTYDHWVADSIAARMITRHVLARYLGINDPENDNPVVLHPGTFRDVFPRHVNMVQAAKAAGHTLAQWRARRDVARMPCLSSTDMRVNYELYHTAPGTVARLLQFARAQDATVHDVILAALSRALCKVLPRRVCRQNPEMAIGSVINTRGDACEDVSESLGVFLSYYLVRCQPSQSGSLAALTREVAQQTRLTKSRHQYLDCLVQMKLANKLLPWLRPRARTYVMRKVLPMTAGVSNVRLCDTWINRYREGRILDFSRGAPTGPLLPLALTPTTLDDQMNIGVTYRALCFSRAKIDAVVSLLLEQLEQPDS
jgi:hypothetical protein